MIGLGTLVNAAAIFIGTTLGFFAKGKLSERFQKIIMQGISLSTIFIGISGVLSEMLTYNGNTFSTRYTMNMIACLVAGAIIGELIDIEKRLDSFGVWCKNKFKIKSDKDNLFVEGFVSSSLIFCVGAMAIIGSLEDGLNHNYDILFTKSLIDGIAALIFSASLGVGVYFSVISVLLYQGSLTFLANFISPFLTTECISQMSLVGSVLIFSLGMNLLFGKKIKVGNLLPAIFIPILICLFL